MNFASPIFLFAFLPLVLIAYHLLRPIRAKNVLLIAAGLVFYAFGDLRHLPLLLASCALHYGVGLALMRARRGRRLLLAACVTVDLAVLAAYKWRGALPLGISFYTFQAISYIVDVSRAPQSGTRSFRRALQYLTFFPQLTAGPLMRFSEVQPLLDTRHVTWDGAFDGCSRFICGLAKKLLLAAAAAQLTNAVYAQTSFDALCAWTGAVCYCLQLYFDFSGYSDMAVGLGLLFGIRLPENFRYPYCADSITDFWRRWHISLSAWFRDYLYIPLGGNRKGKGRQLLNILLVWLATGLWHGADWTFVLWGLLYAALLSAEKLFLLRGLKKLRVLNHIYVLLFVTLGFVLFDADSVRSAAASVCAMFGGGGLPLAGQESLYALRSGAVLLLSAAVGATPLPRRLITAVQQKQAGRAVLAVLEPVGLCLLLAVCTAFLVDGSFNPFLYFRF